MIIWETFWINCRRIMSDTIEKRDRPSTLKSSGMGTAKAAAIKRNSITIPYWARALVPIILALILTGILLSILGKNPLTFYWNIIDRGIINPWGLQDSINRMAPLLLVGASLIVSFRAGLWNIGVDGQFVLAAVFVSATAPLVLPVMPMALAMFVLVLLGAAIGAIWSIGPALLRAYYGINEIITTLMMVFLGVLLGSLLTKTVFNDPDNKVHQTIGLTVEDRWPALFGSSVHVGIILALVLIVLTHVVMTRTAFGLKLRVVGTNSRMAAHAGLPVARLTVAAFAISASLAGLAGTVEVLGRIGHVRGGWDPHYGLYMIPFAFLARFHGGALIGLTAFFAVYSIGGEYAARKAQLPSAFVLVVIGLILILLALTEYFNERLDKKP